TMITPAISVLSAVEGVKVAAPSVSNLIVPITAAIIVCLFLVQRFGSGAVGRLFGPVMAIWFLAIGASGVGGIVDHPELHGAGRPHPRRPHQHPQPLLPPRPWLGTTADGLPRRSCDRDRLTGSDHRRILSHPAGRAARLPPTLAR